MGSVYCKQCGASQATVKSFDRFLYQIVVPGFSISLCNAVFNFTKNLILIQLTSSNISSPRHPTINFNRISVRTFHSATRSYIKSAVKIDSAT
jgi:hypothetical protein